MYTTSQLGRVLIIDSEDAPLAKLLYFAFTRMPDEVTVGDSDLGRYVACYTCTVCRALRPEMSLYG